MAQMHELTLFIGITPRRGIFLLDIAPTREIEYPYRVCKHSVLIHFWPGKALVFGRWSWSGLSETQALMAAMEGHDIGDIKKKASTDSRKQLSKRPVWWKHLLSQSGKKGSENEHLRDTELD